MSPLRTLSAALVRAVVLSLLSVVYQVAVSTSETTDALGTGLLFFLLLVVIAIAWGAYDGLRRGFVPAAGLWVLTAVLAGFGLSVSFLLTGAVDNGLGEELRNSGIFFAVLVGVPALLGVGLGGLVHRSRGPATS